MKIYTEFKAKKHLRKNSITFCLTPAIAYLTDHGDYEKDYGIVIMWLFFEFVIGIEKNMLFE